MSKKVSVRKTFESAFILNEQELRRIYDILIQQMKTAFPDGDLISNFIITFKNEIKETKNNIDDVFSETNGGVWEIKTLRIEVKTTKSNLPNIYLEFDKSWVSTITYS